MPRRAGEERLRFWRDLVSRQRTSGLTVAQWCAQAGVSQNSFYLWKRRLCAPDEESRPALPHRKQAPQKAAAQKAASQKALAGPLSFVPVKVIPDVGSRPTVSGERESWGIEIVWPSGLVLRLMADGEGKTLREVFRLLSDGDVQ